MNGSLTGTATLLRLGLRRDRLKLPIWTIAIALFVPGFFNSLANAMGQLGDIGDMQGIAAMLDVFAGPMYGDMFGDATLLEWFLLYNQEFVLAAAVMNILLVIRHTRGEEQRGRAMLVHGSVIGRRAPLAAALILALITNAVLAVLLTLGAVSIGFPGGSALLFGTGIAASGLVFAVVTGVTAQLAEGAGTAGGLAGLVLGVAWVMRSTFAVGPEDNVGLWLTPMAWPNLTRVLYDERWSPVALSLVVAALLAGVGFALSVRRDVGAGLIPHRRGRTAASAWLAGPFALALRLQRGSVIGWASGMLALGLAWGSLTTSVSALDPEQAPTLFEGDDLLSGYLGILGATQSLLIAVFVIMATSRLKSEETAGRLAVVLGTATGRARRIWSWMAATAVGTVVIVACGGIGLGAASAAAVGDASLFPLMVSALVSRLPELLALAGIGALAYGFSPRLMWIPWALFAYGSIMRFFGVALGIPDPVQNLSLFQWIPRMPAFAFSAWPLAVLTAMAVLAVALGVFAFRRRDV